MARLRKSKKTAPEQAPEAPQAVVATPDPQGLRAQGPWDSSEKQAGDDPAYVDLGSLLVRVRPGLNMQLAVEQDNQIGAVVIISENQGLELRAFAANKSGGLWNDVRDEIILEVERLNGQCEQVDGVYGPELHLRVPVQVEGQEGFQPSRIIGIEGPRWLLRATFLGEAAMNPSDEGVLFETLRDVIVVRGEEPRLLREPLLLNPPASDTIVLDQ